MRRPLADSLREDIYELRVRKGRLNYRILYFFHGRNVAILGHGLTKEDKVPKADILTGHPPQEGIRERSGQAFVFRRGVAMARTKDALKLLKGVTGSSAGVKAGIAQAKTNFEVAQMIYDARTKAGLSQSELADLIGSKQPVIARLEDADYEGHSLTMLQRIAVALEQSLELRFVPQRKRPARRGVVLASSKRKLQPA